MQFTLAQFTFGRRSALLALALLALACGAEDTGAPNTAQSLTDAGGNTTDAGPSDAAANETGACLGESDALVLSGAGGVDLDVELPICVKALITSGKGPADPDFAALISSCLVKSTGLSAGCADCHARFADCSADQCLTQCIANPAASVCVECRCGKSAAKDCIGEFVACSGTSDDTCE